MWVLVYCICSDDCRLKMSLGTLDNNLFTVRLLGSHDPTEDVDFCHVHKNKTSLRSK